MKVAINEIKDEHDLTLAREGYAIKKLPAYEVILGLNAMLAGALG